MAKASFKNRAKSWSRVWHANVGIATAITLGAIALSCPFIAHKGEIGFGKALMEIHYGKFLPKDWQWVWIDLQGAALMFLIVSGWLIHHRAVKKAAVRAADDPSAPGSSVTIVWESGRAEAEAGARRLARAAEERGLRAFATDSRRYESARLAQERWLVCVLSDGEAALPVHLNGEKLPRLEFAVLGTDTGEQTTARCAALTVGLTERGARAFVTSGKVADVNGDGGWTGEILAHLARFTKKPAAQGAATQSSAAPALA